MPDGPTVRSLASGNESPLPEGERELKCCRWGGLINGDDHEKAE